MAFISDSSITENIRSNETITNDEPRLSDVSLEESMNTLEMVVDKKVEEENALTDKLFSNAKCSSSVPSKGDEPEIQSQLVKQCTVFFRKGFCQFESKCRFSHFSTNCTATKNNDLKLSKRGTKTLHKPKNEIVCKFFKLGPDKCKMGDKCLFSHSLKVKDSLNRKSDRDSFEKSICKNFLKYKMCRFGNDCRFSHQISSTISPQDKSEPQKTASNQSEQVTRQLNKSCSAQRIVVVPKLMLKQNIDELNENDFIRLRDIELIQLKKRYPTFLKMDHPDESYQIIFFPSDPDWPFDVKLINLRLTFPCQYPKEVFTVQCIDTEGQLPLILQRHINKCMELWLMEIQSRNSSEGKIELVFKSFIRWLDRNIEEIFIDGLKMVKKDLEAEAAGFEFIPHEYLVDEIKKIQDLICEDDANAKEEIPKKESTDEDLKTKPSRSVSFAGVTGPVQTKIIKEKNKTDPILLLKKCGTEINLCGLEIMDETASFCCKKLSLIVECSRCRMASESVELLPQRNCRVICSRCSFCLRVSFRNQLMHPFMAVLGYLDLENCQPLDIPITNCYFDVDCLGCNGTTNVNGFQYGKTRSIFCLHCNKKMTITLDSVKFQTVAKHSVKRLETKPTGGDKKKGIQEGKPLPENGTCKHYKKSFRWLRFPCCGKVYPCDLCHNEQENVHEMKIATRMICGFCGKEQAYSNGKECVLCRSNMTKMSSSHWEGGKGCREKIKMSREDKHKFAGTRKTISRKSQAK